MTQPSASEDLDVVAIGSAIVDVLVRIPETFLADHDLVKGSMALVDLATSDALYANLPAGIEISGGSAANTAAGIGSLGGRVGFVGKVRDDQIGAVFSHDISHIGVEYNTAPAIEGPASARCLVMITPDAERTMCTYLGAAGTLASTDVDLDQIRRSQLTYAEGYLWDAPSAKEALVTAFEGAHATDGRTAFTLSDPFCVDRFRGEFRDLIDEQVDLVFANEAELCSLFEVDDFDAAIDQARERPAIWAVTRSELGSVICSDGKRFDIPAAPVDAVVDTTGAGDLYAAGFLYGFTHGHSLPECARLGSRAASEVISHIGARPQMPLSTPVPAATD